MAWLLDQKETLAWLFQSKCLRVKHRKMLQDNTGRDTSCEAPSSALDFFFFHMIAILPTRRSDSLLHQILQEAAAQEVPYSKWPEHPSDLPRMWGLGGAPFQILTFVLAVPSIWVLFPLSGCCSLCLRAVPSVWVLFPLSGYCSLCLRAVPSVWMLFPPSEGCSLCLDAVPSI